jgi:hypothetical protein
MDIVQIIAYGSMALLIAVVLSSRAFWDMFGALLLAVFYVGAGMIVTLALVSVYLAATGQPMLWE